MTAVGLIKNLHEKMFFSHTFEILMGFFLIFCIASMINHGFFPRTPDYPSPWFTFITAYLFPFIVFYFAKKYITRVPDIKLVFNIIFFIGCYVVITAFFEFYQLYGLIFPRYISNPELGIGWGQARGPLLNSAHFGTIILFGLACGMHLFSFRKGVSKLIFSGLFLLFPFAVFFSQTRAVYLAFVMLFFIYILFYRSGFPKWKVFALPMTILFIIFFALLPILAQEDRRAGGLRQPETVEIREGLFEVSIMMIKDNPFFGVGLTQFLPATAEEYRGKVPILDRYADVIYFHNYFLGITTELGLTAALIFIAIILLMFKRLFALSKYLSSSDQFLNKNFIVVVGSVWTVYWVIYTFSSPEFVIYPNAVIFMFAGIVDGLYQRHRQLEVQPAFQTGSAGLQYRENPA